MNSPLKVVKDGNTISFDNPLKEMSMIAAYIIGLLVPSVVFYLIGWKMAAAFLMSAVVLALVFLPFALSGWNVVHTSIDIERKTVTLKLVRSLMANSEKSVTIPFSDLSFVTVNFQPPGTSSRARTPGLLTLSLSGRKERYEIFQWCFRNSDRRDAEQAALPKLRSFANELGKIIGMRVILDKHP